MVIRHYLARLQGGMQRSCRHFSKKKSWRIQTVFHNVFSEYSVNILVALRYCSGNIQVVFRHV